MRQRMNTRRLTLAILTTSFAGAIVSLSLLGCGLHGEPPSLVRQPPPAMSDPILITKLREDAAQLLAEAAVSDDPQLRANALEGLHPAPSRAAPFVRRDLIDDNIGVRFVAAMTAGKLGLGDTAPTLRALLHDPSVMVQSAAIYALRQLHEPVDLTPLADMLRSEDVRVRSQTAFVLGELGDPSAAPMLRNAAKRDIRRASIAQMRLLRLQIAEALVKLGDPDAIETIRAALYPSRVEDLESMALAVQIIGEVGDLRSAAQLVYLTAQKSPNAAPAEVRLAAAASLAQLGQPRGGFIADELRDNPNPALRAQVAFVYGQIADAPSLAQLQELMEDMNDTVRVAAASAVLHAADAIALNQSRLGQGAGRSADASDP